MKIEKLEHRILLTTLLEQVPADGFYLKDVTDDEPASLLSGPTYGRGDVLPTGVVGYAPDLGFRGEDSMEIGLTGAENLVVTFIVGNRPPDAVADSYTTTLNTPILQSAPGMLGNDSDPDGDAITARIDTQPAHGIAMAYSSGLFLYWPNEGFVGEDQFQYSAIDEWGAESAATVTVQVNAPSEITRTFEIRNTGEGDLILTGGTELVQVTGFDAEAFVVTQQPQVVVPPGEQTEFIVTFIPSREGLHRATVSVPNNDADESGYAFAIQGTGEIRDGAVAPTSVNTNRLEDVVDSVVERWWGPLPLASGGLGLDDLVSELLPNLEMNLEAMV